MCQPLYQGAGSKLYQGPSSKYFCVCEPWNVTTGHLYYSMDDTQVNEHGHVSIKLYSQNQAMGWIWPMAQSLPLIHMAIFFVIVAWA